MLSASTGLLSTLIVIPVALHELGSQRYGLWVVLWQLVGYLNILDLGVAYAATRDLAAAQAAGDRRVIVEVVASGFYLYAGLGIAFFALGWILLPLLPVLTRGADGTIEAARWPLFLLLGHGLLGFPTRFISAANIGAQAIAASGVVGFVQGLTNIAVAVLLLRTGAGLIALPIGIIASDLIAMVLQGIILARVYGLKTLRPSGIRAAAVRRLLGFGLQLFATGMAWTIVSGTDSIVISARLGLAAVALFAVSYRIPSQLVQLVNLGVDVTMPGLTGVMTAESVTRRSETYAELLRAVGAFAGVCAAGVVVLLRPFMRLWVGPEQMAGVALVVVMAYLVVHHPVQHVLGVAMVAARDVRVLAAVTLAEAGANLGLSLLAVGVFGVPGVLYATALAGWINVGYGLWKSARLTGLRPSAVLAAAFGNAAVAAAVGVAAGLLVGLSRFGGSWGSFLIGAGGWAAITLIGLAIVDRLLLRGRLRTTVRSLLNAARSGRAPVAPAPDSI
jgi:O-antigen/teichoic acid export membrane protein